MSKDYYVKHKDKHHVAAALLTELNAKGIRCTEASKVMGVDRSGLSRVLNSVSDLTPSLAAKLSHYLGIDGLALLNMQAEIKYNQAIRECSKR